MPDSFSEYDSDRRVSEANAFEETTKTNGWKLFLKRVEERRNEAMRHSLLINQNSQSGVIWRARLAAYDSIFSIVEVFFMEREKAMREKDIERGMPKEPSLVPPQNEPESSLY